MEVSFSLFKSYDLRAVDFAIFVSEMEFQLSDKLYLLVSKFNEYPQIHFRNCVTKQGKVIPTREGIKLILPQYAHLKMVCNDLLNHDNPDKPLEKDLGYGLMALNKICMLNGKKCRKIVLFNDHNGGAFEIGLEEFKKWSENQEMIEHEIQKIKSGIATDKDPNQEEMEPIDLLSANIMPIETAFTHLCALLVRRAVKPCFPCVACHNNMPWDSVSNHTCVIDEATDLQQKANIEIINLIERSKMLREKFCEILKTNHADYVIHLNVLFETFFCAFLKTFSGRSLIHDVIMSSVSYNFYGTNPQSSLMFEIAYIVLEENEFNAIPQL